MSSTINVINIFNENELEAKRLKKTSKKIHSNISAIALHIS